MEIEVNKVYNIDCLDLMREMERQGVMADKIDELVKEVCGDD